MATAEGWAEAPLVREQIVLFPTSIDEVIPDDHEVRLLDEMLQTRDWADWEAEYPRRKGQPPIHPRVLASIWLYGLSRKIKSSRPLEYACSHNIDFIWLAEGRQPDHSTLAAFFTKFGTLDEERRKDGLKKPAQVPMNDLESRVMPNKEGASLRTSRRRRSHWLIVSV